MHWEASYTWFKVAYIQAHWKEYVLSSIPSLSLLFTEHFALLHLIKLSRMRKHGFVETILGISKGLRGFGERQKWNILGLCSVCFYNSGSAKHFGKLEGIFLLLHCSRIRHIARSLLQDLTRSSVPFFLSTISRSSSMEDRINGSFIRIS